MLGLDGYEHRARLAPGLLALLPINIALAVLGISKAPVVMSVVTALSLAGGPFALADIVRHQGRKAQETLWASWGGSPTIQKLRMREEGQNTLQREVWRKAVTSVTGIALPSLRSENSNAKKADDVIDVAVGQLRNLTRSAEKFPLVQAENRSYGFQRNVYGIRWVARGITCGVGLGILAYMLWVARVDHQPALTPATVLALAATAGCLVLWWILPSRVRLKDVAERYAYELLQAGVVLAAEKTALPDADQPT